MKWLMLILALGSFLTPMAQVGYSLLLPHGQVQRELGLIKDALKNYHPGPFDYVSSDELHSIFEDPFQDQDSISYASYYGFLSRIPNLIGDGHLSFNHAQGIYYFIRDEVVLFPFTIFVEDDRIFINKNLSGVEILSHGTEILTINGVSSKKLLTDLRQYISRDGRNNSLPECLVANYFNLLYAEYIDTPILFVLQVRDSLGREGKTSVSALLLQDQAELVKDRYEPEGKVYLNNNVINFLFLEDGIGYLDINTFSIGVAKAKPLFRSIFSKLRKEEANCLVLDLRGNLGGSIAVAVELLRYLMQNPVKPFSGFAISDHTRAEYRTNTMIKTSTIYNDYLKLRIEPYKRNISGKIYVLINGMSVSASVFTAELLRHFNQNVTVVGMEAGSNPYVMNAGSFHRVKLPFSQIRMNIPLTKMQLNVGEKDHIVGMLPDLTFIEKIGHDLPSDEMLNFVLSEIGSSTP